MQAPNTIAAADYSVANKPTLSGEILMYLSPDTHAEVGAFAIAAANSGTWTASSPDAAILAAAPMDLVAMVDSNSLNAGATDVVLTVVGTDADSGALTGTATIAPPGYSTMTAKVFQQGYSVDVVVSGSKKFKTVASVTVACAVDAINAKITLFALPASATYVQIGCKTDLNFTTKSQTPTSIQCGLDKTAYQKPGETEESTISCTGKLFGFSEALSRFDGVRCTALIKVKKEAKLVTDHLYFLAATLKTNARSGEGGDVATLTTEGKYEDLVIMPAP